MTPEERTEHEHVYAEEQEPSGRLIVVPCLVCGSSAMEALQEFKIAQGKAEDAARHLRLIAKDVRSNGDIPLVSLSEEGVTMESATLADELELIAIGLVGLRDS